MIFRANRAGRAPDNFYEGRKIKPEQCTAERELPR